MRPGREMKPGPMLRRFRARLRKQRAHVGRLCFPGYLEKRWNPIPLTQTAERPRSQRPPVQPPGGATSTSSSAARQAEGPTDTARVAMAPITAARAAD